MSKSGVFDHKCKNCDAPLKFNPSNQKWDCEFCKSSFTKEEVDEYEKSRGVKQELTKDAQTDNLEKDVHGMDLYICPNCGAQIIADENTSATFCVYCRNTAILKNKLVGEFNPSKIIPFKKTKEDAIEAFKAFGKGKPLIPKVFLSKESISEIKGIYIPFWLYDYCIKGDISGTGIDTKTWTSGDYRYTKTDTYHFEVGGTMDYKKIPVDGSLRFDNAIMNSIEPFDYRGLVDFDHSYLSGFYAEKYDVDSNTASYDAINRAVNTTKMELSNKVRHGSMHIEYSNYQQKPLNIEYALLPVWLLNIKYDGKIYTFAMNGQTGEMIGDAPVDKKKAVLIFLGIFFGLLLLFAVALLIYGGVS